MAKKPRRKQIALAQNFLRDSRTVRGLLEACDIGLSDRVFEIGAGRGIITAELAGIAHLVIAVEKDPALVQYLRERFGGVGHVEIVEGDFLDYGIVDEGYKIFGNIPFNRTADIMRKIVFGWPVPKAAYLVMQREAAEKFSGRGRESQFSVLAKAVFEVEIVRMLRRTDFVPVPNVDSVLLGIRKRPVPLVVADDMDLFRHFVCDGFGGWKKNLKLTFKPVFTYKQWKRLSKTLGFALDVRPSELTVEQWVGLFDCFKRRAPVSKRMIVKGA
jgi:23S rRNA (adenine-N6)-dimethyltransferase